MALPPVLSAAVPGTSFALPQAGLLAVVSHCTVHNTFQQAPDIAIELA
jgi:hypothetical protein